jgi:hypothetical protein
MTTKTGRPLKVAIFSDTCVVREGNAVYDLAHGLAVEGAEVDVFSLRHGGDAEFEEVEGVRVRRTGPIHLDRPARVHSSVAPKFPPQAYAVLRANPPDVIHAHGTSFAALVAGGVARLLKRPLITTVYAIDASSESLSKRLPGLAYEKSLAHALVSRSDRVICSGVEAAGRAARLGARAEVTTLLPEDAPAGDVLAVYVDALAERELRWFMQEQVA